MRIILIIMANVFVVIAAVLCVQGIFGLKRYSSFTLPFTDKMVALGIIDASRRDPLLKEDKIGNIIQILLSLVLWGMLGSFIAGVSAVPVFAAAVAAQLIFIKPDTGETVAARTQYFNHHKNDINTLKYHEYLQSAEGGEST